MKIVYGLSAVVLAVLALFILTLDVPERPGGIIVRVIPVLILIIAVLIVVNLVKRRLVIDGYRIVCVNLFSSRELALTQISGYRIGRKTIWIESQSPADRRIVLRNYIDFAGSDQLLNWVKANFKDLDAIDLKKEQEEILQDKKFGDTEEERKENFSKFGKMANIYNVAGLLLMLVLLFLRNKPADVFALCYPLIAVLLMIWSKGIIKFATESRRSSHPFILLGVLPPAFMMMIRSFNEYTMLRVGDTLIPAFVVGGILFALFYMKGMNKSIGASGGQVLFMILTALIIGFGSVRRINCEFDTSNPSNYTASVLDHRVTHGKSSAYYLTLGPWGPRQEVREVSVLRTVYNQVAVGDSVRVVLREGVLRIPWYLVQI